MKKSLIIVSVIIVIVVIVVVVVARKRSIHNRVYFTSVSGDEAIVKIDGEDRRIKNGTAIMVGKYSIEYTGFAVEITENGTLLSTINPPFA